MKLRFPFRIKNSVRQRPARKLHIEALAERIVPAAPMIAPIADETLSSNQAQVQVPIPATDSDGDPLSYSVRSAGSETFFLGSDLKLKSITRPINWGGQGERWFKGGADWYFLKPTGEFHKWDGTSKQASGPQLATLAPLYFSYPDLLTKPRDFDLPYIVDQRLGLVPTATPARGSRGQDEQWFAGKGNQRYFITPAGELYRASGKPLGVQTNLLAQLDPVYHANPKLLTAAMPLHLPVSLIGNVVTVGEFSGGAGTFAVQVAAKDATETTRQIFTVNVENLAAPVVPAVSRQLLGVGEDVLQLDLGATDADGDLLTYTVRPAGSEAYLLATDLQLRTGKRPANWGGENEIWFQGRDGWYFLKSSGDFHRWEGTNKQARGNLLTTLQPAFYHFPDLLTKPLDEDVANLLDRKLGLSPTVTPAENDLGLGERWLKGKGGNLFITPAGNLYRQGADAVLLASLGPIYFEELNRLYAAQPDRFAASVSNGILTVTTKPNYFGKFVVEVQVGDGVNTTTRLIPVEQRYVPVSLGSDPRVVSSLSTSNTTIVVTFNNPMNASAIDPGNYGIVQSNVNPEAGTLLIVGARFLSEERDAVELTTLSQSAVAYTLTAVNVRDLAGRQLAPREVSNGVVNDPSKADFAGRAPSAHELTDTDGDGLTDDQEQRGWEVQVKLLNGSIITRGVTSDPFDADSDGDGLSDAQEVNLRLDPRDADSDDDQLGDFQEFNEIFSDPANQDTDGDTLDDSLEFNFFLSNPVDADTDGDQLSDSQEVVLGNRNLRMADVPKPAIEVGSAELGLDVRFTATNSKGSRTLSTKSVESTLTQTENKTFGREDANSHEFATTAGVETGWSAKVGGAGFGVEGTFNVEAGYTGQWSTVSRKSPAARHNRPSPIRSPAKSKAHKKKPSLVRSSGRN